MENYQIQSHVEPRLEKDYSTWNGCCILLINFIIFFASIAFIAVGASTSGLVGLVGLGVPLLIISFFMWFGLFTLQPNEGMVLVLYGNYKGTVKQSGFHWVNPFLSCRRISLRSNNLNGEILKVNDKSGNPIHISATVVWKVKDTYKACFEVENYHNYVLIQSETAVRHLAFSYPYDKDEETDICLREGHEEVTKNLVSELNERLGKAGINVEEARINHLSYSPEIANAMLRRQQAEAVIAARQKIVQGAVSIIGYALNSLSTNKIVELNDGDRAKLVSNLLVVLCSESQVTPTLNTGLTN